MSDLLIHVSIPLPHFTIKVQQELHGGDIVALIGPSGAGKSTLLYFLAGFIRPPQGLLTLNGQVLFSSRESVFLPPEQRRVGYVPQKYALFPHMSVYRNVEYGARAHHVPSLERKRRVHRTLEQMGIAHLAHCMPRTLSGGEAQRVALARSLVSEPDYLLLDEPLAALDVQTRAQVRRFLREVLTNFPGPVLLVTHDTEDVISLADQSWVMENGKIVKAGTVSSLIQEQERGFAGTFFARQQETEPQAKKI